MPTYTVKEVREDADRTPYFDVMHDSEIIKADIVYYDAFKLVISNIQPGDIYQEFVGDRALHCVQTYDEFRASVELSRKFDAGEA
jgi:S-adenosylmethionine hydrolase